MAHQTHIRRRLKMGNRTIVIANIHTLTSVPVGGETVTPAEFGLGTIEDIWTANAFATSGGGHSLTRGYKDGAAWKVQFFLDQDDDGGTYGCLERTGTISGDKDNSGYYAIVGY